MVITTFYKNNKRPSYKSHGLCPINKHSNTNSQFTSNCNVFNNADNMETLKSNVTLIHKPLTIFIKSNAYFKKTCTNNKLYCDTDGFPYKNSISKVKLQ